MKTLTTALLLATGTFAAAALTAATEETLAKTFPSAAAGSLVVDVDFGSLEIIAEPARTEVKVEVWRKITRGNTADEESFLKENPVEFIQDGNTVTIRARSKTSLSWSWFGGWHNRNEARYTVHLPAQFSTTLKTDGGSIAVSGVAGSVKANTSGGALSFTTIHGPVDGHTSGGGIKAVDCEGEVRLGTSGGGIHVSGGSGTLDGGTSGGSVTVKNFNGPVTVETSGGGITLEDLRATVRGHTSGGSIHASFLAPLPGPVDLSTSGGGIHVTVPADAAFNLDASTSGGGVTCDLPLTVQGKIQRSRAVGTVNGGGPELHLRTSGGGIHVEKR
jgi:hypothetical protein